MIAPAKIKSVPLGRLLATPGAMEVLVDSGQSPMDFVARHMSGDWGEVCGEDWELNDADLELDNRLLSAYRTAKNIRIYIITEADRSVTTILLPSEY